MAFQRYDISELKKAKITPQGYLRARALATRAGIFLYKKSDGTIQRELRPADEVFHPDSMESLKDIYVTNDHPQAPLDINNTKLLSVGHTGSNVDRTKDDYLEDDVTIHDKKAIDDVMKFGKRELSCGYTCDLDFTPGIHNGMEYDAVQKNIRYNHLAIVRMGRAGPGASIKLDANDAFMVDEEAKDEPKADEGREVVTDVGNPFSKKLKKTSKKAKSKDASPPAPPAEVPDEKKDSVTLRNGVIVEAERIRIIKKGDSAMALSKVKIGKKEYEVDEAVAELIAKQDEANAEIEKEKEALQGKVDAAEAVRQAKIDAKKKAAAAEEEGDDDDDEENEDKKAKDKKKDKKKMDSFSREDALKLGREIAEAEIFAKKVIGAEFKADGMDIPAIERAILAKAQPAVKLDGKSDEYVHGAFEYFKENYRDPKASALRAGAGQAGAANRTDSAGRVIRAHHHDSIVDPIEFKQDAMDRMANRWRTPIEKLTLDAARADVRGMSKEELFQGVAKYIQ